MKLSVFTDGGARGNPGPAAVGVVIKLRAKNLELKTDEEKIIASFGKYIGETTNNVAEYTAVAEALRWIIENLEYSSSEARSSSDSSRPTASNNKIIFYLDSNLVVNQLNGLFKIKDNRLYGLIMLVRELETKINGSVFYTHIPRGKNWQADKLVNEALNLPAGRQALFMSRRRIHKPRKSIDL